jgi:hypothetical protein
MASGATADVIGYSVRSDGDDVLYRVNLTTGEATAIGPVGFGDVEGLDFHPETGVLYGWDDVTNGLITIDLVTGNGTSVGPSGVSGHFNAGLTFDAAGDLFVSENGTFGRLYGVDPDMGAATEIGVTDPFRVAALADAGPDTLWGVSQMEDGTPLLLVTLDKTTAAPAFFGPLGIGEDVTNGVGIDFDTRGALWGLADDGSIFTIDTESGRASIVATTLDGFEGLAIIPAPPVFAVLALARLGARRRRRPAPASR